MRQVKETLWAAILALALALAIGGCNGGGAAPTATPGSIDDLIAAIVLQDVTVIHLISGDAGCPTSSLHQN